MKKEEFEERFQEVVLHCKTEQTNSANVEDFKNDLNKLKGRIGGAVATTAFLENYLEHLLHDLFEEFVLKEQQKDNQKHVLEHK